MKKDPHQIEIKAIKLLQKRSTEIASTHSSINSELTAIKEQLSQLGASEAFQHQDFLKKKDEYLREMTRSTHLKEKKLSEIYIEANANHKDKTNPNDILTPNDWSCIEDKLDCKISEFNKKYSLDGWDYAIAGSCGLLAAMLDLLCVKAPQKPTTLWTQQVDGIFNQWVQQAFNKILPPGLSDALSKANTIGAPDSSVTSVLLGAPAKTLNPINHRLRSLAHDPILGFLIGAFDMINGTCTVVINGEIRSFPSAKGSTEGNIFQLLGRMFGHLLSDVNAPSAKGNRGMGLPAPFMGLLRMLEDIPIGDSNFGKQIEWMYIKGYDFRQFIVSSIPMTIMEVLLRAFYAIKQEKLNNVPFTESLIETMPGKVNPRFRMILALAYGTSSAVNAGKMYITQDILNANYASWMGLAWNGFHSLKWALLERHLKLWSEIENKEIEEIQGLVSGLDQLSMRASQLPT